jgi:hypothetical protein
LVAFGRNPMGGLEFVEEGLGILWWKRDYAYGCSLADQVYKKK